METAAGIDAANNLRDGNGTARNKAARQFECWNWKSLQVQQMSLTAYNSIDLVLRRPGQPGRVALIIYDSGEIGDVTHREAALRKKIAGYLHFVASGQLAREYPRLSGCLPGIVVVCRSPATESMKAIDGIRSQTGPPVILPPPAPGQTGNLNGSTGCIGETLYSTLGCGGRYTSAEAGTNGGSELERSMAGLVRGEHGP